MREACPVCVDGYDIDTGSDCEVCFGLGFVVPGVICGCGRSATFQMDGQRFCGRGACLKKTA